MIFKSEVLIYDAGLFGHLSRLIEYIKELIEEQHIHFKKFCVWNGVVYRTSDILADDLSYPLMIESNLKKGEVHCA